MSDDRHGDALDWTLEQCLQCAFSALRQGKIYSSVELDPNKLLIIFLHDEEEGYSTRYFQAGMSISEMIALLEIVKARLNNQLNGI
jgi:hypothetical protein